MQIKPKKQILLIQKHKHTHLKEDIAIQEDDGDKRLITGEVLSDTGSLYSKGQTVIFGKYALFALTLQGEDKYFLHEDDVIGTTDYKE